MTLTVKVTNKDFPDDHEFSISGLGVFVNGKDREVTKEQEQAFVDERGMAVRDALTTDAGFDVKGTATASVPAVETTTAPDSMDQEEGED